MEWLDLIFIFMLSIPYPEFLGSEVFAILEFFRFLDTCLDFSVWASLIQNSKIWNTPESEAFWAPCFHSNSFKFWSILDVDFWNKDTQLVLSTKHTLFFGAFSMYRNYVTKSYKLWNSERLFCKGLYAI